MLRFLVVMMILTLMVITTSAQDEPLFTLAKEEPAAAHGEEGSFNFTYTDPGAVVIHDGVFHMFNNGFNGWPASVQIVHRVSENGIDWERVGEEPVLRTDDVPFAGTAALASSAVVADDGTWMLYFYTWESGGNNAPGRIGLATADNPDGPWTVSPDGVLNPGPSGAWDSLRVDAPRVVKTEDGYLMYYGGQSARGGHVGIGRATSPDGIVWTKFDDPATTDVLYAESDPVLVSPDDAYFIHQPMPLQTPDGWVMIFRQIRKANPREMSLHYAHSQDGIAWTVVEDPAVWQAVMAADGDDGFWYTAAVYQDGMIYLYIEIGFDMHTQVYVATYEGSLIP